MTFRRTILVVKQQVNYIVKSGMWAALQHIGIDVIHMANYFTGFEVFGTNRAVYVGHVTP